MSVSFQSAKNSLSWINVLGIQRLKRSGQDFELKLEAEPRKRTAARLG